MIIMWIPIVIFNNFIELLLAQWILLQYLVPMQPNQALALVGWLLLMVQHQVFWDPLITFFNQLKNMININVWNVCCELLLDISISWVCKLKLMPGLFIYYLISFKLWVYGNWWRNFTSTNRGSIFTLTWVDRIKFAPWRIRWLTWNWKLRYISSSTK